MLKTNGAIALTALLLAGCSKAPSPIDIAGSSTVYPFTKAVAAEFVKAHSDAAAPEVRETGTVAGISTFCAGRGTPDILNASRRITGEEFDKCGANKAGELLEIPIGLDGIALAESDAGPKLSVTTKDLYLALAANPMGKPNAAKTWRDVNPKLPAIAIKVIGPPATSGTRDSFIALILEPGCLAADPDAAGLRASSDPAKFDLVCSRLREDGAYVAAGENDDDTVKALEANKDALGLFGFSYLEKAAGKLHGVPINDVAPSAQTIAHGQYIGARQLFLYVKKDHLKRKPAIQQFLEQYAAMWKPEGPLAKLGLIPLSDKASGRSLATIQNGFALERKELP